MLFCELEKQRQRRRGDVRPQVKIAIFRRADVRGCERAQALELEHGVDVGEKRTPALPADGDTRQPRRHGRFDPDAGAFDAVHPIDQRVDTRPPVGGQGVRAEPAALRARRDDGQVGAGLLHRRRRHVGDELDRRFLPCESAGLSGAVRDTRPPGIQVPLTHRVTNRRTVR